MEKESSCEKEFHTNQIPDFGISKQKWKKKKNEREMQEMRKKDRSPRVDARDIENEATLDCAMTNNSDRNPATMKGPQKKEMASDKDKLSHVRLHCSYCNVYFSNKMELQTHCRSQDHQTTIMSDEGRDWTHRPPPRGLGADEYALCTTFKDTNTCRLGDQCVGAHSEDELGEWQERFEYRAMKLERAREKQLHGASYADQLLERLSQSQQQDALITEKNDGIITNISLEPSLRVSQKPSHHEWIISLRPLTPLHVVSLLHDAHRTHFTISAVTQIDNHHHIHKSYEPENNQEWMNADHETLLSAESPVLEYKVTISFQTVIYGTFRQAVIFDFGTEPVLMQRLCVDVIPVDNLSVLEETKKTILTRSERWCEENSEIITFEPKPHEFSAHDKSILAAYPAPTNENFVLTQTSMEKIPTKSNYRSRLHDLLHIEELAQFDLMARFNIKTTLQITSSYMLPPSTVSTAKYSRPGELYGKLELSSEISEDSHHGRLVLTNCNTILVSTIIENEEQLTTAKPTATSSSLIQDNKEGEKGIRKPKRRIYEVLIEDKTKKEIYLRFSESAVRALDLTDDEDVTVEVQFQLNRLPLCEMHAALDRVPSLDMIFPDVTTELTVPWSPIKRVSPNPPLCSNLHSSLLSGTVSKTFLKSRQWGENLDIKLNPKQKEALVAITAPNGIILPPILIIGPYGTGKTYTLAQGIKQVLQEDNTRILICTHSNSAADLYIKEYLHPYVESGHDEAKPLRIYYRNRWVTTVHLDVQKYCLIEMEQGVRKFRMPSEDEILSHRVIVATLNTSRYLVSLNLEKGVFSHILIDEAAQAMECEALNPLALARPDTRLVLAGDYMQLSPEVFSPFCEERGLGTSLLERLYDLYPADSPCKIILVENYRSHSAIIKYTSDLFYEGRLVASGKQTAHPKFYPLTFFTARGEDVQDPNSTAFYNNSEVYEVCEQVGEIIKHWPKEWGPVGESSIGVVTPYADQMVRIRSQLRKRKLYKINVERVLNVQGKQFRVIILSTVRTRHTCKAGDEGLDFGFLSNAKLLTTAITRAQSLVAVVGDPVSLCSVGKCRKLWEKFLQLCSEAGSLYGTTWSALRSQLDGVELKKTYVLNPLAPEFVPRYLYYPNLSQLPMMPTVPPILGMYPYNYIPTYPHMHPLVGPQPFPYILPQSPLPPHWSHVAYGSANKTQMVRPATGRLGQPLIATHTIHPTVVNASSAPYLDPHGYEYQLHTGILPVYPYQPTTVRLPPVRPSTEIDALSRAPYITALPGPYQPLRQVATPPGLVPHTNMRMPSCNYPLPYPAATAPIGQITPQSEGDKSFQFLNNVHFPERQIPSNASSVISHSTRSRAESESPLSTHSRESSHSSVSDGHNSVMPLTQQRPSHQMKLLPVSDVLASHHRSQKQSQSERQQKSLLAGLQQPNYNSQNDDTVLPTPDVVRSIDELISDQSPTKGASPWLTRKNSNNCRGDPNPRVCQTSVEPWSGTSSSTVRTQNPQNPTLLASTLNPWAGTPSSVGKVVTVQELEASMHTRLVKPVNTLPMEAISCPPERPSTYFRDYEKPFPFKNNEESSCVQGLGDIPPPPGFSVNKLVDPLSHVETRDADSSGFKTPSLPLYLRRGSREASSCNFQNSQSNNQSLNVGLHCIDNSLSNINSLGSYNSTNNFSDLNSVWNTNGGRLQANESSQEDFGLKDLALSVSGSSSSDFFNHVNSANENRIYTAGVLSSNHLSRMQEDKSYNRVSPLTHLHQQSQDSKAYPGVLPLNHLNASQDSKTYAGVLRSSLQSAGTERNLDDSYPLKDLLDKRLCTSSNHLYQYFP